MTDCRYCAEWYATTEKQWANRQRNMTLVTGAVPYTCPNCGSSEWATSRERIEPDTSDIPEAGEEFFKRARLLLPKWMRTKTP